MNKSIEKWRGGSVLSIERKRMNEALMRLGETTALTVHKPVEVDCAGHTADVQRIPPESAAGRQGWLVFGLDLTGSREATIHRARIATTAMFETIKSIGSIAMKLVYYRGDNECRASTWHQDAALLAGCMRRLTCEAGFTQIARLMRKTLAESSPSVMVFVGDHCEEEQEDLVALACELGKRSIPLFIFHECLDHDQRSISAKPVFKAMAEASGGVYCEFKPDSGDVLHELLSSVAAFAAAGAAGVKQTAEPQTAEGQKLQKQLLLLVAPETAIATLPRS